MNSKVTEGIQNNSNFAFLNFKRRQNVSKTKLEENIVHKAWNTCSSGFGRNNINNHETITKGFNQKYHKTGEDDAVFVERNSKSSLHERLLGSDYKAVKRKSMLEIGNFDADFFPLQKKNEPCVISTDQFLEAVKTSDSRHKTKGKLSSHSVPKKQCDLLFRNIENPFKNNSILKTSSLSTDFKVTFASDVLSEQENIYKKRKIPDGNFVDLSMDFSTPFSVKEVLKKNLYPPSLYKTKCIEYSSEVGNGKNPDITFPDAVYANNNKTVIQKSFLNPSSESLLTSSIFIRPKVCLNDSSANKGSNWVQSIQWTPLDEDDSNQNRLKKKKLRNTLHGGYAEQLLKLQRREQSEKVIWEHKKDYSKEKDVKNAILMQIIAVSQAKNDLIITKCRCLDYAALIHRVENHAKIICLGSESVSSNDVLANSNATSNLSEYKLCLVLFKKNHFHQLHLKANGSFRLYPPWKVLNTSPCPVILCTYFVESIPSSMNPSADFSTPCSWADRQVPFVSNSKPASSSECFSSTLGKELFFRWGENISLYGRVQRVWYKPVCLSDNCSEGFKNYNISLLVQEKEGTLHEVVLSSSSSLPEHWFQFLPFAEGKCFILHNLHMTHRLQLERHGDLLKFLKSFWNESNNVKTDQKYCYQMMLDEGSDIPEELCDENFPPYLLPEVELMSNLSEVPSHHRVSCIGSILLEHKKVFFVSDKSLLHAPLKKYIELYILYPFERKYLEIGSTVLIKEAIINNGCIILDKYSDLVALSNLHSTSSLYIQYQNKIKYLAPVKLHQVIIPLNSLSMNADIVSIEGVIKSVNDSTAVSFLQCCFCLQENLIQDLNLVIYCEDCSQIVPKPILGIKLEVSLCCKSYKSATVNVQLLSSTVKNILNIKDDTYQPQCRVADVLGKPIGPIICSVKSCETAERNQVFYLQEIKAS